MFKLREELQIITCKYDVQLRPRSLLGYDYTRKSVQLYYYITDVCLGVNKIRYFN